MSTLQRKQQNPNRAPSNSNSTEAFEDFCAMLRPALLMIVRWVERRYGSRPVTDDAFEGFCRMLAMTLSLVVEWLEARYPHLKSKTRD